MSDFECVSGNPWVNLIDVFSSHLPGDTFATIAFELLVYCWCTCVYSVISLHSSLFMHPVSIFFNLFQCWTVTHVWKKRQLRLSVAHPDSVYTLKSEMRIPKLLKMSICFEFGDDKCLCYGLNTYDSKYQIAQNLLPFLSLICIEGATILKDTHVAQLTAQGIRASGGERRWSGADGLWM